jgi:hypothetical protein
VRIVSDSKADSTFNLMLKEKIMQYQLNITPEIEAAMRRVAKLAVAAHGLPDGLLYGEEFGLEIAPPAVQALNDALAALLTMTVPSLEHHELQLEIVAAYKRWCDPQYGLSSRPRHWTNEQSRRRFGSFLRYLLCDTVRAERATLVGIWNMDFKPAGMTNGEIRRAINEDIIPSSH